MTIKALIFDLDGTLIDSAPDIRNAVNKLLQSYERRTITMDETRQFVGNGAQKLIERAFRATGASVTDGELDQLTDEFLVFYDGHEADETEIYPTVIETLEKLKEDGFQLALCTNKPQKPSENILRDFKLDPFFEIVLGGDQLSTKKPHPEMIEWVLDKLGVDTSEALMIGDSPNDIEGGKNAKVKTVAVPYGYRKISIDEMNADINIERISDLLEIVKN